MFCFHSYQQELISFQFRNVIISACGGRQENGIIQWTLLFFTVLFIVVKQLSPTSPILHQ